MTVSFANVKDRRLSGILWEEATAVYTNVRSQCFAPAGKIPVTITVSGTHQKLSMIATVTNQDKSRRIIIDQAFN